MSGVDVEAGMVGYTGAVLEYYFSGRGCYEARRRSSNLTRQGCLPVQAGRYPAGAHPGAGVWASLVIAVAICGSNTRDWRLAHSGRLEVGQSFEAESVE